MHDDDLERRLAAGRTRLLRRVRSGERVRRSATATVVLVLAATGAAALLGAQHANGQATAAGVTCYSQPDLHSPSARVTTTTAVTSGSSEDAARLCDRFWTQEGTRPAGGETGSIQAALCRLPDGSVAVLPVDRSATTDRRACASAGLALIA